MLGPGRASLEVRWPPCGGLRPDLGFSNLASSLSSATYNCVIFEQASATGYHEDRDCVWLCPMPST